MGKKEILFMLVPGPTMPNSTSVVVSSQLTKGLQRSMNQFIGKRPNTPLTVTSLDAVQGKFWPSPNEEFLTELLDVAKGAVEDFVDEKPYTGKKRPVVFSSREGLDIVIGLEEEEGKLK